MRNTSRVAKWFRLSFGIGAGLIAIVVLATGCDSIFGKELNPAYCQAHPDDERCVMDGGVTGCASNAECSGATAVCDLTDTKTCVQCIAPDQTNACTAMTPVCGSDDACHACVVHADCASGACLPDGSCGSNANVAYIDPGGTDNATCTQAGPCTKVAKALATGRPFVKFHGTTDDHVSINNANVTLLADAGAALTSTSNGILLEVKGSSQVTVYDLSITGASGGTGYGVSMPTGNTATLTLQRATISNNTGGGISASGGTLSVLQSTVSGNQGGGIAMSGAGVVFTITNNYIYRNGNTISVSGGGVVAIPSGASKLEFNTIVDNQAGAGAGAAGGVICDQGSFVAAHNIIFRNTGGLTGDVQTFGSCTYGDSVRMAGTSTVDNSLAFLHPNTATFDYHLTAASPSSVIGAAGACTGVDFDGDTRPLGNGCDIGADEYKP